MNRFVRQFKLKGMNKYITCLCVCPVIPRPLPQAPRYTYTDVTLVAITLVLLTWQSSWSRYRILWWYHTACWSGWKNPPLKENPTHYFYIRNNRGNNSPYFFSWHCRLCNHACCVGTKPNPVTKICLCCASLVPHLLLYHSQCVHKRTDLVNRCAVINLLTIDSDPLIEILSVRQHDSLS